MNPQSIEEFLRSIVGVSKDLLLSWKTLIFSGSVSFVLSICYNGAWISFITNKKINSFNFLWFINILDSWLKYKNNFKYEEIMLILDNWSFHKSLQTREILLKLKYLVVYLPVYSPDFAPIKMWFSYINRNLSDSWKNENIKLSQKSNYIKIHNSLSTMKSEEVVWETF